MHRTDDIRLLFDRLLDVPAEDWQDWLDRHAPDTATRAQLQALIDADHDTGALLDTPLAHYADLLADDEEDDLAPEQGGVAEALVGRRFGAFRLVRLLGRGGMATVFLGQREDADFAQQAAVKILHRGLYSEAEQRLFRRERRILARLEHPDIARLIDGGISADGVPFLVLEYIDGVPITEHAHRGGLDRAARLRLMARLARAVDAAHRSLVVHRDLKPGNVLVSADGALKVLDFGIATLVEDDEAAAGSTEVTRLTPGYAAPEQRDGGPITAATDVHALGVLLRELLTGQPPAPAAAAQFSTAAVTTELARIVAMATAAEPGRRYPSAAAFADDIERYLDGRPVHAHPPSRLYRLRKYVARHRGAVAATTVLALALLASLAMALWQAQAARRQALAAEREAERANSVRAFVEQLFEPVREGVAQGRMPAISDLVAVGRQRLEADTRLGIAERVDLTLMFSRLHDSLGERDAAIALAEEADRQAERELDRRHPVAIAARIQRAGAHIRRGDFAAGEPLLLDAEQRLRASGLAGPPLIDVLTHRAQLAMDRGQREEAFALEQQALAERIRHYGPDSEAVAAGYNNLGYGLVGLGRYAEAADAYRHAHAIDLRHRDPDSYGVLNTLSNWGWAMALDGDLPQARERLAEVDDGLARLGGKPRGMHVINLQKLCILETQLARADAADRCARMLELSARVAGEASGTYGDALSFEAMRRIGRGDFDGAEDALAQAWQRFPDSAEHARSRARVQRLRAEIALLRGDAAAARQHALSARHAFAQQKDNPAGLLVLDGLLLLACERAPSPDCPPALTGEFPERLAEHHRDGVPSLTLAYLAYAQAVLADGGAAAVLPTLDRADAGAIRLGAEHPWTRALTLWRVLALRQSRRCAEAARVHTQLGARPDSDVADPWLRQALTALAASPGCMATHSVSATSG